LGRCDVRFAPTIRHFQFAVSAIFFRAWNKKFPVPIAGNSSKEVPCFSAFSKRGGGLSLEIPCIFPQITVDGLEIYGATFEAAVANLEDFFAKSH
jgi:hypothetical protein